MQACRRGHKRLECTNQCANTSEIPRLLPTPLSTPSPVRSDPAHFPFILAYLRDGHIPPLPQGLLELRQLQVEAEFFAMAELAAAVAEAVAANESAAEQAAKAAAFEQTHAAKLRRLDASRAAAVDAAERAVHEAYDAVAGANLNPLFGRYNDAANQLREAQQLLERVQALPPEGQAGEVWDDEMRAALQQGLAEAQAELEEIRNNPAAIAAAKEEAAADKQLRTALLARLCALGADLPAAEAQLRATHPDLADRTFEE